MRSITPEPLTLEAFAPFGTFARLIDPDAPHLGSPPIQFFRDLLPLDLLGAAPVFSICRIEPRASVVDVLEYHSKTGEGILPLDADVVVQVAPATHPNDPVPLEQLRAFIVPRGTMLCIRPGVWHHAPFLTAGSSVANIVIVLPERTYANDCVVVPIGEDDRVQIKL